MWHHPIGAELTSYNPYPLCTRSARWAQEGYGDSDNDIHPKRQRSHQLQAGEIPPFIESPVMSRNTQLEHLARPGTQRIWVVTCDLSTNEVMPRHQFLYKGTGYVVHTPCENADNKATTRWISPIRHLQQKA
jgi:hypothetical protein